VGTAWSPQLSPSTQRARLERALAHAHERLDRLEAQARRPEDAGPRLVAVHAMLARDPVLLGPLRAAVDAGVPPVRAIEDQLSRLSPAHLPGRGAPAEEARAVLLLFQGALPTATPADPPPGPIVLVGDPPSLADAIELHAAGRLAAVLGVGGGADSHLGLLARELGVPAVLGAGAGAWGTVGTTVWVDGDAGTAGASAPRPCTVVAPSSPLPPIPGFAVRAALSDTHHAASAVRCGAEGIGLLRTDRLWGLPPDALAERLHTAAEGAGPHGLTIRSFDRPPAAPARGPALLERAPRAVQHLLDAACALARDHRVRVLVPFVREPGELGPWRGALAAAAGRCGVPAPPLGAMLETPLAAMAPEPILRRVEFAVVGTGDLCALLAGAGREELGEALRAATRPALMRLLGGIAGASVRQRVPVEVAGPAAREPRLARQLRDLGFAGVSVAPADVCAVRAAVAPQGLDTPFLQT
jgi:phosphoenolpyruvate-protein kinase (PTS system EI component)